MELWLQVLFRKQFVRMFLIALIRKIRPDFLDHPIEVPSMYLVIECPLEIFDYPSHPQTGMRFELQFKWRRASERGSEWIKESIITFPSANCSNWFTRQGCIQCEFGHGLTIQIIGCHPTQCGSKFVAHPIDSLSSKVRKRRESVLQSFDCR